MLDPSQISDKGRTDDIVAKEEYGKTAKENSLNSLKQNASNVGNKTLGRTDELIAKEVGFGSRDTYRKAQYIYENADEEMIKQLDEGKLSINKCYTTLKAKAKELEEKTIQLEQQKQQLQSQLQQERNKPPVVQLCQWYIVNYL